MTPRIFMLVVLAAVGVAAAAVLGGALWLLSSASDLPASAALMIAGAGVVLLFLAVAVAWALVELRVLRPLASLTGQAHALANSRAERDVEIATGHALGRLPETVNELARGLISARHEIVKAMTTATARIDEEKGRLEAILIDLSEGVLVCNLNHRVMLYNQAAVRLLGAPEQLGLGRSLFGLVTREPIQHTLEQLQYRLRQGRELSPTEHGTSFVCATVDARTLLQGRMSLVLDAHGAITGYVLSVTDISKDVVDLAQRDTLLRQATEGLRAPVANLRAAAETLASFPDLVGNERSAFEQVIFNESKALSDRLSGLASAYRRLIDRQWPLSDIYSADLINCLTRHLKEEAGLAVTMVGIPLWLHGDSHFLMLTLEHLIKRINVHTGTAAFDIEPLMGDRNIYLDIVWDGDVIPSSVLDRWLDVPLEGAVGDRTARQVLEHHGAELWSQAKRPNQALLRVPLPAPRRAQFEWPPDQLPERPEFYDFELMHQRETVGDIGDRLLRELEYVVFDTETTGLKPSGGDEIVSIAGVRIVNSRILAGETFVRLINPRRDIPTASSRFHNITDDMVRDKPPIQTVLPQFKAFVGDAVLVAHNAAFDMKFLKLKEVECGVVLDNPVLDSLLLSVFIEGEEMDHTLDGIARRFGVEVARRHTALGDALVTAGIFVHLLDLLEARGIRTLNQALEASEGLLEVKRQQEQL